MVDSSYLTVDSSPLLTVSPHGGFFSLATGNYMQMMSVLQPIAFDVLECLSQLFDYYLYAVE